MLRICSFNHLMNEKKLVKKCFPNFDFGYDERFGKTCVTGWISGNGRRNSYKPRLELSIYFPDEQPRIYMEYPNPLYMRNGQSMNSQHPPGYHIFSNGPNDEIQLCYAYDWDATCTCVFALTRALVWIEGFEHHLRTGETINDFIAQKRKEFDSAKRDAVEKNRTDFHLSSGNMFSSNDRRSFDTVTSSIIIIP